VSGWFTRQVIFDGLSSGAAISLVAIGIVLIYRSTRVINFAVGNMGLVGAGLLALLVVQYHQPFWLSVIVSLLVGAGYALLVERVVIRRLFDAPRVIVLVATIGIAQLSLAIVTAYPKITNAGAGYPVPSTATWHVWGISATVPELTTLVLVPIVVVALTWFLARTTIGKTVKAAAGNPSLARTSGISPKLVSAMVWTIAGLLSTLSIILIAGQAGTAGDLATLGPDTLARALAAAVIAGMTSFRRALVAGLAIGVLQNVIGFRYLDQPGLIDALLFAAVVIAVCFQGRTRSREPQVFAFGLKPRPIPAHLLKIWWVRLFDKSGLLLLGVFAVVLPLIVTQPSRQLLYTTILAYAICACSLTVLTGWAGQLSLGQMAFAGIGALTAAAFQRGISLDIGWRSTRIIKVAFNGEPFFVSIAFAVLVTAALAALIGVASLRVRGMMLAVTTFMFALAAQQYFYRRPIFGAQDSTSVSFPRGHLLGLDLSSQRNYYYVVLAVLAATIAFLARLRRSRAGRNTLAVRDNPDGAAALAVPPARTQLRAFALAGAIAGLGGALLAGAVQNIPVTERFFLVDDSLALVGMVVIGGLGSVVGPVLGALWVVGIPAFAPNNNLVALLSSSLGLLILLLYFPRGLVQLGYQLRDVVVAFAARRNPEPSAAPAASSSASIRRRSPEATAKPTGLTVRDLHVRFGGNHAVDGVSLQVGPSEVVGLIGANGAGKTTLMNAIGGFVPCTGSVQLGDREINHWSSAHRAAAGLGRTFQAATLFPELTLKETVQVACTARRTGGALLNWRAGGRGDRQQAEEILLFLGLTGYADSYISDLSTGTRRIVELACLLASGARTLCLDEPTAGVAQRETEAFGPLILAVTRELDACMLIIEHDMPLIMGISDRVYCLETGRVIAHGAPEEVRSDPAVIASYLGTDERAIARSGSTSSSLTTKSNTTTNSLTTSSSQ
jgi:ABC-type branched-subunit amino acid transport system ATPase component/ABC-type branched-subunit amino acid transport system permease subunit